MKKKYKLTDSDFKRMKKVRSEEGKYRERGFHFYLSYSLRIILMVVLILAMFGVSYYCFLVSFDDPIRKEISTTENSNYVYSINPYDTSNTSGNYSSSEVKNIDLQLKYGFETNETVSSLTNYYVDAVMVIENLDDNTIFSENTYNEISKTLIDNDDSSTFSVEPKLVIDYAKYNKLAKEVIDTYKINAKATLYIKMYISNTIEVPSFRNDVKTSSEIVVSMPLNSDVVSLKEDEKLDISQNYSEYIEPRLANSYLLYLGITLLIVGTIILLLTINFIISVRPKKSKYCMLRDGILRDYDRIIVNTKKIPKLEKYNIIDCYSFEELLDAQNLLEKPIVYYEIVRDQKCMFVVVGDNDIYQFVLKECDIDF